MNAISNVITWLNDTIRPDWRVHALMCAALAAVAVHIPFGLSPTGWAFASAGIAGVALEMWQFGTGRGHADPWDVVAGLAGAVLIVVGRW